MMPRLLLTTTLTPQALQRAMDRIGVTMVEIAPARLAGDALLVDAEFDVLQDAPLDIRRAVAAIDGVHQALPVPNAHPGRSSKED